MISISLDMDDIVKISKTFLNKYIDINEGISIKNSDIFISNPNITIENTTVKTSYGNINIKNFKLDKTGITFDGNFI